MEVTDDIESPTIWTADNLYLISVYLYVKNTLVIEPGTIIKFEGEGDYIKLAETGTIIAEGTPDKPIIFLLIKTMPMGEIPMVTATLLRLHPAIGLT